VEAIFSRPAPHIDPAGAIDAESLRKAIALMPLRYREVVVLCDLESRSYEEAAALLDCAVGTIRSRLHRGRELLMRKLMWSRPPARSSPVAGLTASLPQTVMTSCLTQFGNFTFLSPMRTPSFVRITRNASTPSSMIWMTFRKVSVAAGRVGDTSMRHEPASSSGLGGLLGG
jgi:hypothetical protein